MKAKVHFEDMSEDKVILPKKLQTQLKLKNSGEVEIRVFPKSRVLIIEPTDMKVSLEYVEQVEKFIDRYETALKELAK